MGGGEKSPQNTTEIYKVLKFGVNVGRAQLLIAKFS